MPNNRKALSLAAVGTIATIAVLSSTNSSTFSTFLASGNNADINAHFSKFMAQYNRQFMTVSEFTARKDVFSKNFDVIKNNKADSGVELDLNQFADWSLEQYTSILGFKAGGSLGMESNSTSVDADGEDVGDVESVDGDLSDDDLALPANGTLATHRSGKKGRGLQSYPASLNWKDKGAVTGIKNQGNCGSCYAFSAAAAMEGAYQIKTGNLVDFSNQQLLDCTSGYGNGGCNGGLMSNSFNYLRSHWMMTMSDYPYVGYQQSCKYSGTGPAYTKSYTNISNYNALMSAIQTGPVSMAIDASNYTFMFYKGGIIAGGCGTSLSHAVLAVGYGVSPMGNNYWLVKNQWGSGWGESGYFRIYRTTSYPGVCGILMMNSQPQV